VIRHAIAWALLCGAPYTIVSPALAALPEAPAAAPSGPSSGPPRGLTLSDALGLARARHPGLRAAAHAVVSARARERDASRAPTPALGASVENFGGALAGDRTEATIALEQMLQLGGDRAARGGLAAARTELASAELAALERQVEAATVERFCAAWLLQERVGLLHAAVGSAAAAAAAAAERFRAGGAPAHEEARARAFLALRQIELERSRRDLHSARRRLALDWGGDGSGVDSLVLPPAEVAIPPALDSLIPGLAAHPELRRAAAERLREDRQLRLARAERVPDLTLGAGARHLAEAGGTGFVATLSVPLPLPGAGLGAVRAATASLAAAELGAEALLVRLRADLRDAHERALAVLEANRELRARALPALEDALRTLSAGFRAGRFSQLEVQEAHRSLLDARVLERETTADAWRTRHEIDRLAGGPPASRDGAGEVRR